MGNTYTKKGFSDLANLSKELFSRKVKKELILEENGKSIFNTGAYRSNKGEYSLFARVSTHHRNYPSWVALYKSKDGRRFKKERDFFIYPQYTIRDYIYGCEDDRCSRLDEWFVHTYSMLLANNARSPSRSNYTDYIGISLGKKVDEAIATGIVNIEGDKDSACIKNSGRVYLIHRPKKWSEPPCIWYGDFREGFEEAKKSYYALKEDRIYYETIPRIKPPSRNRILLTSLEDWQVFKIGLGAQPLKINTNQYLFTYHVMTLPYQYWWSVGIMNEEAGQLKIKKLLPIPLCLPDTPWELIGDVPKVSFTCGITKKDNLLEAYCGGADTRIVKVSIELDYLNSVIEDYGIDEREIERIIKEYVKKNRGKLMDNDLVDKEWFEPFL